VVGFEPTLSCSRRRRTTRLSHTLKLKRPAGVEPALPPWQGSRLPLHHGRVESLVELSKIRAPGGTRTHVAALRVRSPRRWTTSAFIQSVGPEGLEPSPTWLRARHAAANTLIPFRFFIFSAHNPRGGNRTLDLRLIRTPLQPLSYARSVGPKGVEPLPFRLKGGSATVTPRPQMSGEAYAFKSRASCQRRFSFLKILCSVVVLRIELSATWISARFGQPALDYRVVSRDGRNRTDTIVFPKHVGLPLPNIPLSFVPHVSSSYGSRTHLSALKGQYPQADRRTSRVQRAATNLRSVPGAVGREALESSSPGFQPSARPSQLPTQTSCCVVPLPSGQQKKPDVLVTPGFGSQKRSCGQASQA
jgi:hypothetical protein